MLAFQHYQTFRERLKDFPCTIDYISRARSTAEVKDILKRLASGELNILIGTHRIVGRDVKFNDLGLLIIDEEQKFGVSVKEKLRQLRTNVDTLTLTATPIPRTLQFSLMGARDLSNITTPPPNRYPVQTELERFNADIIREAIEFEMSRNGQVFFINNRIQNIYEIENLIRREVPGVRVAVGHGQMEPDKLERIILDFVNYEYDVLVATTIVENGIDVSNANTIIVNNAHQFGLSELHQLRGRVGRSNRKAFCYLLAPPLSTLTAEARRRLQAIESFAELGSGMHIAMQDLDIRGAGNMLGAEQSGFIADLGYETYQKILEEAVDELKSAVEYALKFDNTILIEEWLAGDELTVPVLDSQVLPAIRIVPEGEFYDYNAKYISDNTQYFCPAGLSDAREQELRRLVKQAYDVVGCRGWSRIDVMADAEGTFRLVEVNTNPGMTSHSLFPKSAATVGYSFEQLVEKILELSAE